MDDYEKLMTSEEFDANLTDTLKSESLANSNRIQKQQNNRSFGHARQERKPNDVSNQPKPEAQNQQPQRSNAQNAPARQQRPNGEQHANSTSQNRVYNNRRPQEVAKVEVVQNVENQETAENANHHGKRTSNLKIMFLGGIGEIGKNMTVFEYGDDIFVLDCGLMFPSGDMLGIDLVIPDYTYLQQNANRIRGIVITHGHEDHIGALPFFLADIKAPIYSSKMTLELINKKMEEHRQISYKTNVVKPGQSITLGCFKIQFIHVNHSIAGAMGLAISTPVGMIVHTGDFKIDLTPVKGDVLDLSKFAELGSKGVLLYMADSTNAERPGFSMSESSVSRTIEDLFLENEGRRITVATFASNVYRLQEVMNIAEKFKRKVIFTGRSMVNISDAAQKIGEIDINKNNIIEIDKIKNYKDGELCIISTGSQGEPMSALVRMSTGDFKGLEVGTNDTIIFSSSPIPGNEKMVNNVINRLIMLGAKVVYNQLEHVHASGHACSEELKLLLALVKPKFFIPVHGEQKHLVANKELAQKMGVEERNVIMPMLGMKVEVNKNSCKPSGSVPFGSKLIDGAGVGELQSNVIKERKQLSEDGLCIVIMNINQKMGTLANRPEIVSRGFTYNGEAESWLNDAKNAITKGIEEIDLKARDYQNLRIAIKKSLTSYFNKKLKRRPLIVPIILETGV